MSAGVVTRREFLKSSTTAAVAGALFLSSPGGFAQTEKTSRVVLIRSKDVLDQENRPRAEILQRMLDEAVTTLLDEADVVKAWKRVIVPEDIVGIKTNVWGYLPTPGELEQAIKKRIMDVGVPDDRIGLDDRGVLGNPRFKKATALVNVRPIRTHHWTGVGTLIKNYIMFVSKPWDYHADSCADLATIWKLPIIAGKTRLNILVALTPLFHGLGPHHYNPKYTWAYKGLLVGLDPVAVDATGVRILLAKRNEYFGEERPLSPPPKHVYLADTRHGLGTANPEKIELIKLGWEEGILI